jgi:hypothetical protein
MSRDPLFRLLKNAALHAREDHVDNEMPFPVQARILGAWRAVRSETESFLPLLRRAVLAAGAVTAVAIALTLFPAETPEPVTEVDEVTAITRALNEAVEVVFIQ